MANSYRSVPVEEVFADFSPERRARVAARTRELIAEQLALRALSERDVTELIRTDGDRQVYLSQIECDGDMTLSALRDYVGALGGQLQLIVSLPDRTTRAGTEAAVAKVAAMTSGDPAARRKKSA